MNAVLAAPRPISVIDDGVAMIVGDRAAYVLRQVDYLCGNVGRLRDGRRWAYNSFEQWHEKFPWLSLRTIKSIFGKLKRLGVLLSRSDLNRHKYDRTNWYAIDYQKLSALMAGDLPFNDGQVRGLHDPVGNNCPHLSATSSPTIPKYSSKGSSECSGGKPPRATATDLVKQRKEPEAEADVVTGKSQVPEQGAARAYLTIECDTTSISAMKATDVLQSLKSAPEKPKKVTPRSLAFYWRKLMADKYDIPFAGAPTGKELGQFKQLIEVFGDGISESIAQCITEWNDFSSYAQNYHGAQSYPVYPAVAILLGQRSAFVAYQEHKAKPVKYGKPSPVKLHEPSTPAPSVQSPEEAPASKEEAFKILSGD